MIVHTNPNEREPAADPVIDLVLRLACEAAQMWLQAEARSREWMEREAGIEGWRAFASKETLAAVEELERRGEVFEWDADQR